MLSDSGWCSLMLFYANWCWLVMIDAGWYWLMLVDADWCRLMLIDSDWCCLILIDSDWSWLVLIDVDWFWIMLANSDVSDCVITWSVNLNWSDQVPALCTAWRWYEWRGSWAWRCDWSTAGASSERAVKCAAGMERGGCGGFSNLAQLCFSASSEPFCLCRTCNAESAPTYYLSPFIKCAGWGWGGSTLGCSPSTNMLLLCCGEAPLLR